MSVTTDQRDVPGAPDGSSVKRRREATQHVREARDRLTSTTGTRPAFDNELLRLFAQNRLSASLVILPVLLRLVERARLAPAPNPVYVRKES